jgi:hypothetical protein
MAGADLRGKAHRRARVRLLRGSGLGASVPVRVRGSNSSGNEARAGLCGVAADMAAAEWRRRNAGVVFWLPEWHTRHYSTRKRKRGNLKCSPRPEIEQGGGVGSRGWRSGKVRCKGRSGWQRARGSSRHRGGADALLGRGSGAAERRNHGGAVVRLQRRGCGHGAGVQRWRRCGEGRLAGGAGAN